MNRVCAISVIVVLAVLAAFAKSEPPITMLWPAEKPALKLIFDKFRQPGSYAGQNTYVSDVTLQNLTDKPIPRAVFTVDFLDKNKVRIGQGTLLKVDGADSGITPVMVRMTVGTPQLALTQEGYAPGNTPVDLSAEEFPGGSITVELGGLSRDTVELQDGSVVLGDVLSMSMTEVVVGTDGKEQTFPRNQVKKVMIVERVKQERPAILQPAQAVQPK
jgi:PEGA domain